MRTTLLLLLLTVACTDASTPSARIAAPDAPSFVEFTNEVPNAPANLAVEVLGYANGKTKPVTMRVTWTDTNDKEWGTRVRFFLDGNHTYQVAVAEALENVTTVDVTVPSGTYEIVAQAVNITGTQSPPFSLLSPYSNAVTVVACERKCR
jgi:hypothetical protein